LKYTQSNDQRFEVHTLSFRNARREGKEVRHDSRDHMQDIFDTTDKVEEGNISKG
jgi:hypothetical protein